MRTIRIIIPGTHRYFQRNATNARRFYSIEQQTKDHKHCVELVQTRDMDGYLCGLLMPSSSRQAYFALRAFNVEIANIKDASRSMGRSRAKADNDDEFLTDDSSLASRLRMQWWKDGIAEVYENRKDQVVVDGRTSSSDNHILRSLTSSRKQNPVMRSLSQAIHNHHLTHRFLRSIIEAREEDLDVIQYEKCTDVAQYGEDTVSSVLYLTLETVGVRDDAADTIASDIGVGLGLITALRSTAFRAMQGECSFPLDLTNKYSISMDTIYNAGNAHNDETNSNEQDILESQELVRNASKEMSKMARFHMHRARANQNSVPKDGRPCLLPAVCGIQYLDALDACNHDVFHPTLADRRRLNLMLLLGRAWLTGSF